MENKTYAKDRGKKTFDWNKFLNKEHYTLKQLEKASLLSGDWVTCACGNQCNIIPRHNLGEPSDILLASLGRSFYHKIVEMQQDLFFKYNTKLKTQKNKYIISFNKNRRAAKKILKQIEKRSAKLIKEISCGKA